MSGLFSFFKDILKRFPILRKLVLFGVAGIALVGLVSLIAGKIYQHWDQDDDRGAKALAGGLFGESYNTPIYLEQGWDKSDSLWYYNTTQGSDLLPYDFFLVLEQAGSEDLFRSDLNMDKYRYLPQKATFFNPDGLPVGFVKDSYRKFEYLGFTCAACHTSQVNYNNGTGTATAIRIDGGAAMSDMVGLLSGLNDAMNAAKKEPKRSRFVNNVLALKNSYKNEKDIMADLDKFSRKLDLYNVINATKTDYGYARLDAFGRIFNRALAHIINRDQIATLLAIVADNRGPLLTQAQIDKVLEGVGETIIGENQLALIVDRLASREGGYPGLNKEQMLKVRAVVFNEPNAPVSYPFLWDIAQSDYVQWNGLANNAGIGPLGRNAGEVVGVFGTLDWTEKEPGFSLSAKLSGQDNKKKRIEFDSSINLVNLERLETHLRLLQSPQWPEDIFGKLDNERVRRGRLSYERYCESCHQVINRSDWNRKVIAKLSNINLIETDPLMAKNSVAYTGKSGNFKQTYQKMAIGTVVVQETAPVAQILTSAVTGVVATPDRDKWPIRRLADWLYTIGLSIIENTVKDSVKSGNYLPDTTANPYNSLLSYKARPLNGIWATAPYLHNGSVPTLYDLLLADEPRAGDAPGTEYRPQTFRVGSRDFDAQKVGFKSAGYDGFLFNTKLPGNSNSGHEYSAGRTAQLDGVTVLPPLSREQRRDLLEFLKSL